MPDQVRAGQIGFAHSTGPMGRLIRLGEWLRFRKGSKWNHMFAIDRVEGGVAYVIQAELRGVTSTRTLDEVAPGGSFELINPPPGVDAERFLFFLRSQVGVRYGVLTILAIALDILTWNWFPSFRGARKNSWICSALVLEALRLGGWYHEWRNIYQATPAEGYVALT